MFEIGQECIVRPVTFNISPYGHTQATRGTITYVHPLRRYVTVSVETPGGTLRESFFPGDVQIIPTKKHKHKK